MRAPENFQPHAILPINRYTHNGVLIVTNGEVKSISTDYIYPVNSIMYRITVVPIRPIGIPSFKATEIPVIFTRSDYFNKTKNSELLHIIVTPLKPQENTNFLKI